MSTRPPNCSIELTKQSKHRFCSPKSSIYTPPVHSLIACALIEWYQNGLRSCHDSSIKTCFFQGGGERERERGEEGERGREGEGEREIKSEKFCISGDRRNFGDMYHKLQQSRSQVHKILMNFWQKLWVTGNSGLSCCGVNAASRLSIRFVNVLVNFLTFAIVYFL